MKQKIKVGRWNIVSGVARDNVFNPISLAFHNAGYAYATVGYGLLHFMDYNGNFKILHLHPSIIEWLENYNKTSLWNRFKLPIFEIEVDFLAKKVILVREQIENERGVEVKS